eukprot:scaffold911_cov162-Ochromonas_danica.AAC.3
MVDLWVGLEEEVFQELKQSQDVEGSKKILNGLIQESDVDHSLQRELILDQLYSTLIFIIAMDLDYSLAISLFKLVVEEFALLMEKEYDYRGEDRLRGWITQNVSNHHLQSPATDVIDNTLLIVVC